MRKEVREGGRREADGSRRARTGVNRKWYRYTHSHGSISAVVDRSYSLKVRATIPTQNIPGAQLAQLSSSADTMGPTRPQTLPSEERSAGMPWRGQRVGRPVPQTNENIVLSCTLPCYSAVHTHAPTQGTLALPPATHRPESGTLGQLRTGITQEPRIPRTLTTLRQTAQGSIPRCPPTGCHTSVWSLYT